MKLNPWSENRKLRERIAHLESDLRLACLKGDDLAVDLRNAQRDLDNACRQLDVERRSTQQLVQALQERNAEFVALQERVANLPKRDPKTGRMIKAEAA